MWGGIWFNGICGGFILQKLKLCFVVGWLDGKATFEVQCFLSVNFRNRSCFGMGMGGKGGRWRINFWNRNNGNCNFWSWDYAQSKIISLMDGRWICWYHVWIYFPNSMITRWHNQNRTLLWTALLGCRNDRNDRNDE